MRDRDRFGAGFGAGAWAGILLALVMPLAATAETVPVRSGEHAEFVRLVLRFDAAAGWRLGRVPDGWEFRAADSSVVFDTSAVFDRIPRSRIAGLSQPAGGVLRLRVACACHASAFGFDGGSVVIDIRDGAASPENVFEASLPDLDAPAAPPRPTAGADDPASGLANAVDAAARAIPAAAPPGGSAFPRPAAAEAGDRGREFEARLIAELARAGSQGLIVAGPDRNAASDPVLPDPDGTADIPAVAGPEPLRPPADAGEGVRIETVIDRDSADAEPAGAGLTAHGLRCPAEGSVAVAGWGYLPGGVADIGVYRRDLTGEFDRLDPDRALALARYYIYLGFGAEAKQVLAFAPADAPDAAALAALAEIVDQEGSAPVGMALDGFETCDSPAALWAMLAGPPLAIGQDVNENAVILAFDELPPHARILLGPRLIGMLGAAGRIEAAASLRNAMNLAGPGATAATAVANAALDLALGDAPGAEAGLGAALADHDPAAPEALLALAELRLKNGQPPDPVQLEALVAIAYEQRGSDIARRIGRVQAETLVQRQEFETALEVIRSHLRAADDPKLRDLLRRLHISAASQAESAVFLRLVLPEPAGLTRDPPDMPARRAIAGRLLDLGFASDAQGVLGPAAGSGEDHAARLLGARALLMLGDPAGAIAAVAALDGPEATGLLAAAQEAAGRFDAARRLYAAAGRTAEAERMALAVADWGGLAAATDAGLRDMAARLTQPPPEPGAEIYGAADRLIEASRRDRAAIDQVLAAN